MYASNGQVNHVPILGINYSNCIVIATIDLGAGNTPFEFAYDPINDEMYVTNLSGNEVFRIDAAATTPVLIKNAVQL